MKKSRLPDEIKDTIQDILNYLSQRDTSFLDIVMEQVDMLLFGYWGGKFYDNLRFKVRRSYP